jgi:hypothetical protein
MKYIIIKALLGFGDRLESLIMYTDYALRHNLIMCIDWSDEIWSSGLESFKSYFSLDIPQISLDEIPSNLKIFPEFWKDRYKETLTKQILIDNNIDLGILTKTYDCDVLVVVSYGKRIQYGDPSFFFNRLKIINPIILEEIQKRKSYDLKNCVGIHLRGTDRFKTRELKVKRIKQLQLKLISRGLINSKKIIVSDDEEFIKLWKQFDDSPVLSNKIPYIKGAIHLIKCEYTKDELNIQLIIDFITLSFCKEVFSTSEDSRFAKCAQKAKTFF